MCLKRIARPLGWHCHVCFGIIKRKATSLSIKPVILQDREFSSTQKLSDFAAIRKALIPEWFATESAGCMANDWDRNLWNPTLPQLPEFVAQQDFYAVSKNIQHLTRKIYNTPYDAGFWMLRGAELVSLGYFDLAAGDIYKASLLFERQDAMIPGRNMTIMGASLNAEQSTQFHFTVYKSLIKILMDLRDTWGSQVIGEKAKEMFTSESSFGKALQTVLVRLAAMREQEKGAKGAVKTGAVLHKAYPFQPYEYLIRKDELIQSTQKAFKAVSPNCELLPSRLPSQSATISDNSSSSPSPPDNFFGVFATRNIARGELILEEVTILGAANFNPTGPSIFKGREICGNCYCTIPPQSIEKVSSDCCSAVYCSEHCKTLALAFYHKVLCQQNFQWLLDEDERLSIHGLMWLRTLAICVQSDCHPLDHPQIARLTPQYEGLTRHPWSLCGSLFQPIGILLQLGVDVFRDPRYDTWVLQAVRARIVNNQYGYKGPFGKKAAGIASLYSFFNHSCEPNAWEIEKKSPSNQGNGTSRKIAAKRAIRKGEEILITYVDPSLNTKERQRRLSHWFGGHDCRCPRCQSGD